MGYLATFGPRADPATALTWGLLGLSCLVVAVISVLVVAGAIMRRQPQAVEIADVPVRRSGSGLKWIYWGLGLTLIALAASIIWTVEVLAEVNAPGGRPAVTIEVTGHQWWWEARYLGRTPQDDFVTANELHIPVGEPVMIKLIGADVIHSFWVPALTGKTDTIPGRTNVAWLQANAPGIYRGQCAEYCGEQHAHMALYVAADPPEAFAAWATRQRQAASAPASSEATTGEQVFVRRCGACHTVRGSEAGGVLGPDLTHLAGRSTIASGMLPNTIGNLDGWILNPQALKPGAKMPPVPLSAPELASVTAYLEGLS
jgi:cytochrome c oxidase subunit 2